MVLTKPISSVSRQHKRDRSLVAYERSNEICTRCHSSLFSLSAYKLCTPLYRWTHTLFVFLFFFHFFFLCLEALFSLCHTFSSFVYLSHRACFGALLNTTHTHTLSRSWHLCNASQHSKSHSQWDRYTKEERFGYKGRQVIPIDVRRCQPHKLAMIEVVSMMVVKLRRNPGCQRCRRGVDVGAEAE